MQHWCPSLACDCCLSVTPGVLLCACPTTSGGHQVQTIVFPSTQQKTASLCCTQHLQRRLRPHTLSKTRVDPLNPKPQTPLGLANPVNTVPHITAPSPCRCKCKRSRSKTKTLPRRQNTGPSWHIHRPAAEAQYGCCSSRNVPTKHTRLVSETDSGTEKRSAIGACTWRLQQNNHHNHRDSIRSSSTGHRV